MITIDTPIGPFSMTGNGSVVTQARFAPLPDLPGNRAVENRHHAGLPGNPATGPATGPGGVPEDAVKAVRAYFEGDIAALDRIPVRQSGTPYLEHCWEVLRSLREPVTYTEFAHLTGKPPTAVRAAAQGCARNGIALIVPCHRVLRTDGTLGGYRWGLHVKEWLLKHEDRYLR